MRRRRRLKEKAVGEKGQVCASRDGNKNSNVMKAAPLDNEKFSAVHFIRSAGEARALLFKWGCSEAAVESACNPLQPLWRPKGLVWGEGREGTRLSMI